MLEIDFDCSNTHNTMNVNKLTPDYTFDHGMTMRQSDKIAEMYVRYRSRVLGDDLYHSKETEKQRQHFTALYNNLQKLTPEEYFAYELACKIVIMNVTRYANETVDKLENEGYKLQEHEESGQNDIAIGLLDYLLAYLSQEDLAKLLRNEYTLEFIKNFAFDFRVGPVTIAISKNRNENIYDPEAIENNYEDLDKE